MTKNEVSNYLQVSWFSFNIKKRKIDFLTNFQENSPLKFQ